MFEECSRIHLISHPSHCLSQRTFLVERNWFLCSFCFTITISPIITRIFKVKPLRGRGLLYKFTIITSYPSTWNPIWSGGQGPMINTCSEWFSIAWLCDHAPYWDLMRLLHGCGTKGQTNAPKITKFSLKGKHMQNITVNVNGHL